MKPSNVARVLTVAIRNRHSMMLTGAPGVGKTDLVKQAAKEAEATLIISHPVVSDPTDYKGIPWVTTEDGRAVAKFLPFSNLRRLVEAEGPTLFLLDDLGQAPQTVQAAAMQLLLARAIDEVKVSDQVTFFACTNRREDKSGVQGILETVKSRMISILEIEVDVEDWVKWGIEHGVPFGVISFVRWRPNQLHSFKPTRDMTNSPCPRTVYHACKIMQAGYPRELEMEMIRGACGEAWATEWEGFRKYEEQIPNVNKILTDPNRGEIPSEAHLTYALCGALAERVTEQNFENIIIYSSRLGEKSPDGKIKARPEFGIMLIKDCLLKDNKLRKNKAYVKWQIAHMNVIL